MDAAQVLRELWRRRAWMALGVLVAVVAALAAGFRLSVIPPRLESKSLAVHTANASVLVDTRSSAVGNVLVDLRPLIARASVYTRYATTLVVRRAIARAAGLSVDQFVVDAPFGTNLPREASQPVAAQRAEGLLRESRVYYLRFSSDSGLPVVFITANAPSVDEARRLADAGAQGLIDNVSRIEIARRIPLDQRVALRQLGSAEGGTVAQDVKLGVVIAAFVGVMIAWALLVLLVGSVARSWRSLDSAEGR